MDLVTIKDMLELCSIWSLIYSHCSLFIGTVLILGMLTLFSQRVPTHKHHSLGRWP